MAGPLVDGNLQSGGRLTLDTDLLGSFLAPRLQGAAQGEALSVALLDQGVRLEQGQLALRFAEDALYLDRLVFSAPYQALPRDSLLGDYRLPGTAGQLSASGSVDFAGGKGEVQISAVRLPMAQTRRPLDHRIRYRACTLCQQNTDTGRQHPRRCRTHQSAG